MIKHSANSGAVMLQQLGVIYQHVYTTNPKTISVQEGGLRNVWSDLQSTAVTSSSHAEH